jgi:alkanesulfonate monooxygenase SsuD/methylene tetrahydromethanopterin reductase-like flavin-dependent oxidoreductase (luciferase family)
VSSTTLEETAKDAAIFRQARADAGLPPAEHVVRLYEVACAPDEATALKRAAPFVLEKYAAYTSWGLLGVNLDKSDAPEQQLQQLAANRFGVGSPAQVTEALMAQHRLGINHLTMRVSWPGMRQDDILASIELLGRDVLPEVRRRVGAR